jgi:hypothetical protein
MSQPKLNWVKEVDPNAEPTSVRVLNGLVTAGFLLLFLRVFWHNQLLLMVGAVVTYVALFYAGLFAIFGARSTVLNLWFPRIKRKWLQGQTDDQLLFQIRVIGVIFIAFLLIAPFQIIRTSFTSHTVQHLGR